MKTQTTERKGNRAWTVLGLIAAMVLGLACFTSCDDDDWSPMPPSGWTNTFYDSLLVGNWELVQYNSQPVTGDQKNYMQFDASGRGNYYYYQSGVLCSERIAYWCQRGSGSQSNDQINIKYASGSASTMNYWFSDRNQKLWMQWYTDSGTMTYVYEYIDYIP